VRRPAARKNLKNERNDDATSLRLSRTPTAVLDALTVADQTAGPDGRPMTVSERMADMLSRHGSASPNARAHPQRSPYLSAAATRVADRLDRQGIDAERHRIL
jgi:hypothetical protein